MRAYIFLAVAACLLAPALSASVEGKQPVQKEEPVKQEEPVKVVEQEAVSEQKPSADESSAAKPAELVEKPVKDEVEKPKQEEVVAAEQQKPVEVAVAEAEGEEKVKPLQDEQAYSPVVKPENPEQSHARQSSAADQPAQNRQNNQNNPLQNFFQPLNPGNFLSNLIPGRNSERRQIGETCQYSSDCLAGTDNSVCFNGTCLCNLGYRYTADTKQCTPVDVCPSCPTDSCSSGTDVYCNGTCIRNLKAISAKGLGDTGKLVLNSPNWPENYPSGTDVYYCITASAGRRVNLKLDWLDLETNCGFNCDYVRVYNGCVGKPSELLAMYHGDNARARECVTSSCNQMLVHFHSDASKGGIGDERTGFMGFIREATYNYDLCNKCSTPAS